MISAISSRVFPRSTRFLICSIRSGVNLSRRPDFDGNSTNVIFSLLIAAWIDRPFETFQVVDIGALLSA